MPAFEHDTHAAPLLFISDLHLDRRRPEIIALFHEFLRSEARQAGALYILGDLFEAWIGDDAVPASDPVLSALRELTASGVPVRVMRGNRDFLLGPGFEAATGATLLPDPTTIAIDGEPVLLLHGDALCTDDHEYQQFRAQVREPAWQAWFLGLGIDERIAYATRARQESSSRNQAIDDYLMDVNAGAVEQVLRDHGLRTMIHGHTHRPAVHELRIGGAEARRIVLGDWYDQGSVLRWHRGEFELAVLPGG
jgi:UDP-2,3-diacylglucosamine hydrolase